MTRQTDIDRHDSPQTTFTAVPSSNHNGSFQETINRGHKTLLTGCQQTGPVDDFRCLGNMTGSLPKIFTSAKPTTDSRRVLKYGNH